MTVKQSGIDTTTSLGSNTILTMNGNEIEQISQSNFSSGLDFVKTINRNYTTTTVTGLSEQDMHTYTFSAGTFATNGDTYYWHGGLSTLGTASAATNTLRLYVDGTVVMTVSFTNQGNATAATGGWDLTLMRKDATTLMVVPKFFGQRAVTTTFQWSSAGTQTVTLSNSFIIKVTGQCGQSAGTMSALGSILTRA